MASKGGLMKAGLGCLARHKPECSAVEHGGGNTIHNGLRMDVKIAVELVRAPPPDQANSITVDATVEKGHGPSGARGAGGDVGGRDRRIGIEEEGSSLQPASDFGGGDVT